MSPAGRSRLAGGWPSGGQTQPESRSHASTRFRLMEGAALSSADGRAERLGRSAAVRRQRFLPPTPCRVHLCTVCSHREDLHELLTAGLLLKSRNTRRRFAGFQREPTEQNRGGKGERARGGRLFGLVGENGDVREERRVSRPFFAAVYAPMN